MKKDSAKLHLHLHPRFAPILNTHVTSPDLLIMLYHISVASPNSREEYISQNPHSPTQAESNLFVKRLLRDNTK